MKPEVIGVTTEYTSIAKILGVKNEYEYGLYQETEMGKYYARFLPDGTFEPKVVRLISCEEAKTLESNAVAAITKRSRELEICIPIIDMNHFNKNFNENLEKIRRKSTQQAEKMKEDIANALKHVGFYPTLDSIVDSIVDSIL